MRITVPLIVTISVAFGAVLARAQKPAYQPREGPIILIDAGHHNIGLNNRPAIIKYLENDGFRVRELEGQFDDEVLEGVDIVIIEGALAKRNALPSDSPTIEDVSQAWRLPTPSAFSGEEISVLNQWVETGGSLLLVFDHMPLAGAAQELAQTFGIEISNGYAVDERLLTELTPPIVARAASIVFRRSEKTLADHPITNGRNPAERVDSVATFVGSAFRLPSSTHSLMTLEASFISLLPEVAWEFSEATASEPIDRWSQGGALHIGQGRLAVFGEHGILVTPEMVATDPEDDEGNPQLQNPQLLLNVLHWLSGLLDSSK